jgi:OOP family OmpA-OmpF porin
MPETVVIPAAPFDSDKDGVPDSIDRCPVTTANAVVNQYGCELDGDRDGIADELDRCWDTPLNAVADTNGCSADTAVSPAEAVAMSTGAPSGIIELPGVNFRSNSNILLDGTSAALDAAALTLLDNPQIEVEVAGHTDAQGDSGDNASLSLSRALVVRDYLIGLGVAPSRIVAHGYGDSEPVADNATADGRAANRRVELRVLNKQTAN